MRRLVLGLALCLSACSSGPFNPRTAALDFSSRVLSSGEQVEEAVHVTAGTGTIGVHATLTGPDPCRTLSASLLGERSEIRLRVLVEPPASQVVCTAVVGYYEYDALISGLTPATYELEVVHAYPGTGWSPSTTTHTVLVE